MKADFNFYVVDPQVLTDTQGKALELRFQTVEESEGRYRRSGKYIHLTLTPAFAMGLMTELQGAKQKFGWPDPPPLPPEIHIPPETDRH